MKLILLALLVGLVWLVKKFMDSPRDVTDIVDDGDWE